MKYIRTLILSLALLMPAAAAIAQQPLACFARTALMNHLGGKFKEKSIIAALAANGDIFEIWSSKDGETFTATLMKPNGAVCVIVSGESLNVVPYPEDEDKGT